MTKHYMLQKEVLISSMVDFVERFREVTFRFEFDERRACFLISYDIPSHLLDEDEIWEALFSFKSKIREEFGEDAPIFMEGESICKLSPNAQLLKFEESSFSSEDVFQSEETSLPTASSFDAENQPNYTFSINEIDCCFFDGYEEYLLAA